MKKSILFLIIPTLILFACIDSSSNQDVGEEVDSTAKVKRAKFEPEDGKVILFIGQDLGAIGGLENYTDGYFDHFETPAGFTMYTKIRPGDTIFNFVCTGLSGLTTTDNWGAGDCNMQMQIDDPDFDNCALAIGLELVNNDSLVAVGAHDSLVVELGEWIKGLGRRPVFLRIAYEFDGHDWNHYNRKHFISAYMRIKDKYDEMGVTNVAYVWQSTGFGSDLKTLEDWYPGDEYVDWVGYSFFASSEEALPMHNFAKKHKKPLFIAEATPTIGTDEIKTKGLTKKTWLGVPEEAEEAWEKWFIPFFKTINENPEVKAISYINCNWQSQPMWEVNPTFKGIDSRLNVNEDIKKKWNEEISKEKYLKASPTLFDYLWNDK